mmetsp:Transcript_24031/g.68874  ORF Transcript_24031/g.68874 Transcript_24031/m.68874 type:complete len:219 (-) Transcript_24031:605-1261(-)
MTSKNPPPAASFSVTIRCISPKPNSMGMSSIFRWKASSSRIPAAPMASLASTMPALITRKDKTACPNVLTSTALSNSEFGGLVLAGLLAARAPTKPMKPKVRKVSEAIIWISDIRAPSAESAAYRAMPTMVDSTKCWVCITALAMVIWPWRSSSGAARSEGRRTAKAAAAEASHPEAVSPAAAAWAAFSSRPQARSCLKIWPRPNGGWPRRCRVAISS